MKNLKEEYDVVIIGAGHNALVSACYLSMAGLSVLVLEKNHNFGGATQSKKIFPGLEAYPSQYSYLVSLFPEQIVSDLRLSVNFKRREVASYTPAKGKELLISNNDPELTDGSIVEFACAQELRGYRHFLDLESAFAKKVWPTMLKKIPSKAELKAQFTTPLEQEAWELFVEKPLGYAIEKYFSNDAVRGLIFTDAKIGMLTYPHDPSMLQNRTFLYHIIGRGTGEWLVPVGGMTMLSGDLAGKALCSGAEIVNLMQVQKITTMSEGLRVSFEDLKTRQSHSVLARYVLCGTTPTNLAAMVDKTERPKNTGSVFKINMLLKRLPKLKDTQYTSEQAFAGTFHVNEGYEQMIQSYRLAKAGMLPKNYVGEMYCHTLTDPTILSDELEQQGYHTLTFFGLDMPYGMFSKDHDKIKKIVLAGYLRAINSYLAEPIEDCLAVDGNGNLCIEAKTPVDLENELGMTEGNIFHGDLSWPFAEDQQSDQNTVVGAIGAAGTWGVETTHPRIFICGAAAYRGGCVSGIPGHNAAMAVLEQLGKTA